MIEIHPMYLLLLLCLLGHDELQYYDQIVHVIFIMRLFYLRLASSPSYVVTQAN